MKKWHINEHGWIFPKMESNKKIFQVSKILNAKVTMERLRRKNHRPIQCYNCVGYHHSSFACHNKPKCVKCARSHRSTECMQCYLGDKVKCANCGGKHHAKWSVCPENHMSKNLGKGYPEASPANPIRAGNKPTQLLWNLKKVSKSPTAQLQIPPFHRRTFFTSWWSKWQAWPSKSALSKWNSRTYTNSMGSTKKIQQNLKMAMWKNRNGLAHKKDIASYMEDHGTDIVLLQEVKLNHNAVINMLNYMVYRTDRTAILVKSGILHQEVKLVNSPGMEVTVSP